MKTKLLILMPLAIFVMLFGMSVIPGSAVNGSIQLSNTSAFSGSNISIRAYNLDPSTAYAVYKGAVSLLNWTTGASETERILYTAADSAVIFYLYSVATTVDSITFSPIANDSFIPVNMLITLGVSIMVIYIIARVIRSLRN